MAKIGYKDLDHLSLNSSRIFTFSSEDNEVVYRNTIGGLVTYILAHGDEVVRYNVAADSTIIDENIITNLLTAYYFDIGDIEVEFTGQLEITNGVNSFFNSFSSTNPNTAGSVTVNEDLNVVLPIATPDCSSTGNFNTDSCNISGIINITGKSNFQTVDVDIIRSYTETPAVFLDDGVAEIDQYTVIDTGITDLYKQIISDTTSWYNLTFTDVSKDRHSEWHINGADTYFQPLNWGVYVISYSVCLNIIGTYPPVEFECIETAIFEDSLIVSQTTKVRGFWERFAIDTTYGLVNMIPIRQSNMIKCDPTKKYRIAVRGATQYSGGIYYIDLLPAYYGKFATLVEILRIK